MPTRRLPLIAFLFAALPLVAQHQHGSQPSLPPADPSGVTSVNVPPDDIGIDTLASRAQAQRAAAGQLKVFHDFTFTDRLPESKITFVHGIVDDAGKTYKPAHYDHGNGIAAADVDGDGKLDVYFPNQVGGSQLWKNLGDGTFKDITAEAGVGLPGRVAVSAAFADIDNDGDQDLFVTTVRFGDALFENDGKGRFKDISKAAGLDYVGHSSGAVFFDYDRDGKLDLLVANVGKYTTDVKAPAGNYVAFEDAFQGHLHPERTEISRLYHNLGGNRFADVTEQVGLKDGSWTGDASAADFNEDGWPDLYLLNMQGDDHYWENHEGKSFVEVGAKYFPKTPWGAMGIKVFDADNDGRMDLLLTDMHSDMLREFKPEEEKLRFAPQEEIPALQGQDNNVFGNAFYKNLGGGSFVEVSGRFGLENYWPWGVSVDDLNADGWDDVLITSSMNFPFRYGINSLLLNNRGEKFLDSEFLLGIEPRRGGQTRKPWFTLDCSGADKAHPRCKDQTGRFVVNSTLGTRSAVIFDLDGDGDLDIVTNEFGSAPQVLVSDLAQKRKIHWLEVRLQGSASNRNGLGARVKVHAGDRTLTKALDGSSGYLSHSLMPLYFGLDEADKVDSVEILWPSGATQTVPGPVAVNRILDVKEPAKTR
ncbi:MAG: CRTAC1 family protein [Acidobacteriota bacterium]